jgi:hypothetical protein
MRIFNGTKSQVNLPYAGGQRISISPMSVSGNIGPTDELISLIVTAYRDDELAIIVSGPYELTATSRNPVAVSYVVQSLDEAVQKFAVKGAKPVAEEPKPEEPKVEVKEEPEKTEEKVEVKEEVKTEAPAEKPKRGRGRPKKNA